MTDLIKQVQEACAKAVEDERMQGSTGIYDVDEAYNIAVSDCSEAIRALDLSHLIPEGYALFKVDEVLDLEMRKMIGAPMDAICHKLPLTTQEWPLNNGWQDISTAPKDGTELLLWNGECRIVGRGEVKESPYCPGVYIERWELLDGSDSCGDPSIFPDPIMWQPLPPAPKEK